MNKTKNTITTVCGNRMLQELRHNNCSYLSLIAELIDNVAAELSICRAAKVEITVFGPWISTDKNRNKHLDLKNSFIEVEDNATGIPYSELAECLSLASKSSKESLHEHCLGMKTAIVSLGELNFLITKSDKDITASRIEELAIGSISVFEDAGFKRRGTLISIKNLTTKVYKRKEDYTTRIIKHLGARYAALLDGTFLDGRKLEIVFRLADENKITIQDSEGRPCYWEISPVYPIYRNNKPEIDKEIKGKTWGASLKFGFAANEDEFKQSNLDPLPSWHPYHPWCRCLDVVMHGRTICNLRLEDIVSKYARSVFAQIIGVLTLRHGFKTAFTKDGVLHDDTWEELRSEIGKLIEPIIKNEIHKEKLVTENENYYRDKLKQMQENGEEKEVFKNYAVEGTDGHADLLVGDKGKEEKEVWELKTEQASGLDVYQLLYYMDHISFAKKDSGRLIAPSFSDGCRVTADLVKKSKGINIKLKTFHDVGLE